MASSTDDALHADVREPVRDQPTTVSRGGRIHDVAGRSAGLQPHADRDRPALRRAARGGDPRTVERLCFDLCRLCRRLRVAGRSAGWPADSRWKACRNIRCRRADCVPSGRHFRWGFTTAIVSGIRCRQAEPADMGRCGPRHQARRWTRSPAQAAQCDSSRRP